MGCFGKEAMQTNMVIQVTGRSWQCGAVLNDVVVYASAQCEYREAAPFTCPDFLRGISLDGIDLCLGEGFCDIEPRDVGDMVCTASHPGVSLLTTDVDECVEQYSMSRGAGEPCDVDLNCLSGTCVRGLCREDKGCEGAGCEVNEHCQDDLRCENNYCVET